MVQGGLGFPKCEFCNEGIEIALGQGTNWRKLKMNDGTRKEGWLCNDCDPFSGDDV